MTNWQQHIVTQDRKKIMSIHWWPCRCHVDCPSLASVCFIQLFYHWLYNVVSRLYTLFAIQLFFIQKFFNTYIFPPVWIGHKSVTGLHSVVEFHCRLVTCKASHSSAYKINVFKGTLFIFASLVAYLVALSRINSFSAHYLSMYIGELTASWCRVDSNLG